MKATPVERLAEDRFDRINVGSTGLKLLQVDERTLQVMAFREDKATALAAAFLERAGGELEYLKLLKLMYLAERESLRVLGSSLMEDTFVSMKHGPF